MVGAVRAGETRGLVCSAGPGGRHCCSRRTEGRPAVERAQTRKRTLTSWRTWTCCMSPMTCPLPARWRPYRPGENRSSSWHTNSAARWGAGCWSGSGSESPCTFRVRRLPSRRTPTFPCTGPPLGAAWPGDWQLRHRPRSDPFSRRARGSLTPVSTGSGCPREHRDSLLTRASIAGATRNPLHWHTFSLFGVLRSRTPHFVGPPGCSLTVVLPRCTGS